MKDFQPITLEHVRRYLDFASSQIDDTIARKQLEGVAGLWKLLGEHRYAYLADEVGMGKTYQALGVAVLTWMANPNARILVIAPNKSVQQNWVREYRSFMHHNVKQSCDRVKDRFTGYSRYDVLCHDNLAQLVDTLLHDVPGLHIARLSSFSHLTGSFKIDSASEDDPKTYAQLAAHLRDKGIFTSVPDGREELELNSSLHTNVASAMMLGAALPRFDLVIIDEAHLLRNRGENIRTNVLSYVLGMHPPGMKTPIAQLPATQPPPTLFLSATPAHRSESDIYAQLAYVDKQAREVAKATSKEREVFIKERFVRRLRLFCEQSKYAYRDDRFEQARAIREPGSDASTPALIDELFFIASQQAVEQTLRAEAGGMSANVKFGFLECFESYEVDALAAHNEQDGSTHHEGGERMAPDSAPLKQLVRAYQEATLGTPPPHPKMGLVEEDYRVQLCANIPEKLLIFVRRRASVTEITRRICRIYDDHTLGYLSEVLGQQFDDVKSFQAFADAKLGNVSIDDIPDEEADQSAGESVRSRVLETFATRAKDARPTNRFRNRFRTTGGLRGVLEENLLRTLHRAHHPQQDKDAPTFGDFLDEVVPSALRAELNKELSRASFWNSTTLHTTRAAYHVHTRVLSHMRGHARYGKLAKTMHAILVADPNPPAIDLNREGDPKREEELLGLLERRSIWGVMADQWHEHADEDARDVSAMLSVASNAKREVLERRAFLRNVWDKNLRIGEGILELFCAFVMMGERDGGAKRDRAKLAENLAHMLLAGPGRESRRSMVWRLAEFGRMAKYMEPLLRSTLNRKQHVWAETNWALFDQQEPILGVMGGSTSRDRAITQFNTPFFPDLIVCTDVLREGVNLHRCCRRVWHYGMSATPGDIEQRTGRVDRYSSVVHRALREEDSTPESRGRLDVGFPYLGQSIDEEQLAKAIANRLAVQPLLDRGTAEVHISDALNLTSKTPSLAQLQERLHAGRARASDAAPFAPRFEQGEGVDPFESELGSDVEQANLRSSFEALINALLGEEKASLSQSSSIVATVGPAHVGGQHNTESVRLSLIPVRGCWSHALEIEVSLPEDDVAYVERLNAYTASSTLTIVSQADQSEGWSTRLLSVTPFECADLVSGEERWEALLEQFQGDLDNARSVAALLRTPGMPDVAHQPTWQNPPCAQHLSALLEQLEHHPHQPHTGSLAADLQHRRQQVFIVPLAQPRPGRTHLVRSIISTTDHAHGTYEHVSLPADSALRRIHIDGVEHLVLQGVIDSRWSHHRIADTLTHIARAADMCEWHTGKGQDIF